MKQEDKIKDINEIASVCSDCGTCLFSCPVYNAELTEPNSPRGKVNLIKSLMDGRLEPNKVNKKFIYQCALCGSCEHICTKGVAYTDMMIKYRGEAAVGKKIPWLKKVILFLYQSVFLRKMIWAADIMAKTSFQQKLGIPRRRKANIKRLIKPLSRASKLKKEQEDADILFFPGCVLTMFYPEIIVKTVELLKKHGFSVIVPKGIECCGFPYVSQGWTERFETMKKKNAELFSGYISQYKVKYIVASCGTCVMTLKNFYGFREIDNQNSEKNSDSRNLTSDNSLTPNIKVYELTQFVYEYMKDAKINVNGFSKGRTGKITWHDPCHHLKSLGIEKAPRHYMKQLGERFIDDKSALCCGFGGIFSVGFPSTSKKILKRKVEKLNELNAETVVTACPGCYLHLRERLKDNIDVAFFTDLFDEGKDKKD